MADQIPAAPTPSISKPRPRGLDKVGTAVANSTISVKEYGGNGILRQTEFTFTNTPLSLFNSTAAGNTANSGGFVNGTATGVAIYTFPKGKISVIEACSSLTFTTTSAIASTLNSGVTVQYGFGSAYASAATLATTMINFLAGTGATVPTFTSSTTINVASATVSHSFLTPAANTARVVDGSSTPASMFFNIAVSTDTDLDADATLTVSGTFVITWINTGGFDYQNT